ncbi:RNA polymerase sigma factor [Pleionea mediterranea]|uniref:RNA polymerase sigma-70 factor (ECF subfamily) n=1 Tax=Pleionea mediterranea TaxID=523701 RepID=A0A316FKA0_9GAMM|nr:sigma-70 family RNA polymerase sigma factor [Pleionea mediterranea]PWK48565.1 RNA polymerase sigma-70 factor (ECF subfamily) [Pleionea mediterranea]
MNERFLIQRSINGDHQSFERLVVTYEQALMRFLRIRCHCQSDADDIFQETFINAHRYLASYDSKYAFSTWLFHIAINAINRFYRDTPITISHKEEITPQIDSTSDLNIWKAAKNELTDAQFHLLWLTYAEGYTGKEVSVILNKSLPWVKINLVRAKQSLKALLQKEQTSLSDWVS